MCVGFACRDGNGGRRFAFPAEDRETIQSWLGRHGQKVFHNAAYDVTWLQSAGLEVKGPIHDTSWILAFENGVAVRGLKPRGAYQYAQHLPKDTALYPRWSAPTAPTTPSTPSRSTIRSPRGSAIRSTSSISPWHLG